MCSRTLLLLALTALAGCHETVLLGAECADENGCRDAARPSRPAIIDAGAPATTDAEIIPIARDASLSVAAPGEFPTIGDPSFELDDGGAGVVSVLNLSLDPTKESPVIKPWRACQIISIDLSPLAPVYQDAPNFAAWSVAEEVDAGSQSAPNVIKPFEGATFVTVSFPPVLPARIVRVPLSQELPTPITSGTRYALSVRLQRVDEAADYTLQVYGTNTPCVYPIEDPPWAEVKVPSDQTWTKACLSFTAPADATQFMIVATSSAVFPTAATTLAFLLDDIRADSECAAPLP